MDMEPKSEWELEIERELELAMEGSDPVELPQFLKLLDCYEGRPKDHLIAIDGIEDGRSHCTFDTWLNCKIMTQELATALLKHRADQFYAFSGIEIKKYSETMFGMDLDVTVFPDVNAKCLQIGFSLSIDFRNWRFAFTADEILEELEKNFLVESPDIFEYEIYEKHFDMYFCYEVEVSNTSLKATLDIYCDITKKNIAKSIKALIAKSPHSCSIFFDLPSDKKTICAQYLLSFANFLQEVGLNANIEAKIEFDRILFTLEPLDQHSALWKIEEALRVYLDLPRHHIVADSPKNPKALLIQSNVSLFKAQISLVDEGFIKSIDDDRHSSDLVTRDQIKAYVEELFRDRNTVDIASTPIKTDIQVVPDLKIIPWKFWCFEVNVPGLVRKFRLVDLMQSLKERFSDNRDSK